jgi:PhzF family phenazine biosynthesis protein
VRRFKQVDVFTDRPFLGNPVAVVIDAEGLDTPAMQRIACWTNLSETTFLLPSKVADYKLRIFTPCGSSPREASCHSRVTPRSAARTPRSNRDSCPARRA